MGLKKELLTYLERRFPSWENGGRLEIVAFDIGRKGSNASRRLRELAEAKEIDRKEDNGSVWYRAKHGPIATINNIQVPVFKEVKSIQKTNAIIKL